MAFNANMNGSGELQASFNASTQSGATFEEPHEMNVSIDTSKDMDAAFNQSRGMNVTFTPPQSIGASFGGATQIIHEGSAIVSNTVEGWNSQRNLVSKKDMVYVYTDYRQETDGEGKTRNIPGVKIGDGKAYLIDLPFTDAMLVQHMSDMSMHVSAEDRAFWNSKVRAYTAGEDNGNLVFTQF